MFSKEQHPKTARIATDQSDLHLFDAQQSDKSDKSWRLQVLCVLQAI
jgi:hypothetical protein